MVRFLVFGKKRQSVCHSNCKSTLTKVHKKTKNQKQNRFRKHPNDLTLQHFKVFNFGFWLVGQLIVEKREDCNNKHQ